jgi:hypothetical protein
MYERKAKSKLHAFRKFFDTQLTNSQVHPNAISKMMGHKDGLKGTYYRPEIKDLFDEYKKSISHLTISEKFRQQFKIKNLEKENDVLENKLKIADLEKNITKLNEHMDVRFSEINETLKSFISNFK